MISKCFQEISEEGKPRSKETIGVTFYQGKLDIDGIEVELQIWEISGNERYKFLFKNYVKGAKGGIFIYDITDKSSVNDLDKSLNLFRKSAGNVNVPILMMGNKSDLIDKREISSEDAYKMAKLNILIGPEELSAKSDDIKNIFSNFIRICLHIDRKKHFLDVFIVHS